MAKFLELPSSVFVGKKNPDGGRLSLKTGAKPLIVTPLLIGMTLTQATNALRSAGLVLGTVTLTTGPVTAQSTAVYTKVNRGTVINITLTA
jgi:beta-lactam-binding protein with PASTA domain